MIDMHTTEDRKKSHAPTAHTVLDLSKFEGAIFDVDGTLLDSMFKWQEVEEGYIVDLGITPQADFEDALRYLSQAEIAEYFREHYGVEKTMQDITDEKNKMMEPFYINEVKLKDDVVELLELIKAHGIKMCVATASDKYLVDAGMKRLDILKYFSKTFSCVDENTMKSEPDIFIKAAEFLGTDISKTIVFEDALHAIKSAKSAGFTVVAVYDGSMINQQAEIKQLADYHYDCWSDFLNLYSR